MREIKRYFYDENCNKIESKNAVFHDEIAREYIQNNADLLKEYNNIRKKGFVSASVFLVMKGFVYVGETGASMSAMFSGISLNKKNKNLLMTLKEEYDCYLYDIIRNELNKEQLAQIKEWYNEKMPKKEIANKVMTDMLALLAPTKVEQDNEKSDAGER